MRDRDYAKAAVVGVGIVAVVAIAWKRVHDYSAARAYAKANEYNVLNGVAPEEVIGGMRQKAKNERTARNGMYLLGIEEKIGACSAVSGCREDCQGCRTILLAKARKDGIDVSQYFKRDTDAKRRT